MRDKMPAPSKHTLDELADLLSKKLDRDDMDSISTKLSDAIAQHSQGLDSKYASYDDTANKFAKISKKQNEIFALIQLAQSTEDDGAFTKKKFGPLTCLSCEKNLTNVEGLAANH